jgi:hypothetical protein
MSRALQGTLDQVLKLAAALTATPQSLSWRLPEAVEGATLRACQWRLPNSFEANKGCAGTGKSSALQWCPRSWSQAKPGTCHKPVSDINAPRTIGKLSESVQKVNMQDITRGLQRNIVPHLNVGHAPPTGHQTPLPASRGRETKGKGRQLT